MSALAQRIEDDLQHRAANDDCFKSGPRTRTKYVYDELNRLTAVDYANSSLDVALAYDQGTNQNGRLTTMADGSGTTTFEYDAFGNVVEESKTIGANTHVTTYEYDEADRVTSITYPSGRTVDYTRNVLGQITTVDSAYSGSSATVASSGEYEPFGPLKSLTFGNSLTLSRTFDQQYRLTDQTTGAIQDLVFTLDDAGNIDAITDGVNAGLSQGFDQDDLNRVTTDAGSYGSKTFAYDEVGNRLSRTHGVITQTLVYETGIGAPDLSPHGVSLASSTGTPPGSSVSTLYLDASVTRVAPSATVTARLRNRTPSSFSSRITLAVVGSALDAYIYTQTVSKTATSLDWNAAMPATPGQYEFRYFATLNTSVPPAAVSPTVTVTSSAGAGGGSLSYGGESNRLATHTGNTVTIDDAGNTTADPTENLSFVYDDHNRMVEGYVGAVLKATYVYNGQGQRAKKVEATGAQRTLIYHYGLGGELLGETIYSSGGAKIGERDYLWLDSLPLAQSERTFSGGSVTSSSFAYLHADQLNTPRLATNGSGTVVWRWDSDAFGIGAANQDPDSDTNIVNIRLRFPGQYLDEETGLHYNYFRDYDPVIGRYAQSDPIGLAGGLNPYLYVGGNPLVAADPYGLISVSLSLYRGYGIGITIGYENGKKFVVADAGVGLGLGFSLNPFGGFPRGEDTDSSCPVDVDGAEAFFGAQGTAGATLGPFGIGGTGYTGWHLYRREGRLQRPRFVEGSEPNFRARTFSEWLRAGLQLTGGFRGGFAFE